MYNFKKQILHLASLFFVSFSISTANAQDDFKPPQRDTTNKAFKTSEVLNYNAYYSIFKIAEAQSLIDSKLHFVGGKYCYKTDISAKLSTVIKLFSPVDELFGAYVDTLFLKPTTTYRYLKENKYTHDEVCYYDYPKGQMLLTVLNKKNGQFENKDSFRIHEQIYDVVSAYLNLRSIDFKSLKKGAIILLNTFIEDELFPIAFTLDGYETIKVKAGKIDCIRILPSLPNNKIFNQKYPIKLWVSNDLNKIFVKVEAKMKFGKATLELKDVQHLQHPFTALH